MTKRAALTILTLTALVPFLAPVDAFSQRKNSQIGEIDLDSEEEEEIRFRKAHQFGEIDLVETKKEKRDPYKETQTATLAYFEYLQKHVADIASGEKAPSEAAIPEPQVLRYAAATYLYCSINKGVCPEVLDAVLEVDIVNSRLKKEASCETMKNFWRAYLADDMEKKHGYQVKTGYLRETRAFKKDVLPQYLRCTPTVTKQISLKSQQTDEEFFTARYGEESPQVSAVTKTNKYVQSVSKSVQNIFAEISKGLRTAPKRGHHGGHHGGHH